MADHYYGHCHGKMLACDAGLSVRRPGENVGLLKYILSLTWRGVKNSAECVWKHRSNIASGTGQAAIATAKVARDLAPIVGGATVGVVKAGYRGIQDASGHLISDKALNAERHKIEQQSRRYKKLTTQLGSRTRGRDLPATAMLDSLLVGGETLASYINAGDIPNEIQRAYELTYPNVAAGRSFIDQVGSLDSEQLVGFASGLKGKLFELQYVDYLNDGHLPEGFRAALAESATQPGWDIGIYGPDGALKDAIQAKATDSVDYVRDALERYPEIDVVTTSEVHSHLLMQGFADNVIDGGVSEDALSATVDGALDGVTLDWTPSIASLAIIAFSAYSEEGLSVYQKSVKCGERSLKSYLAYLGGGALAWVTQTWWLGVLGGMGTRLILDSGRSKRARLGQLKDIAQNNEKVLARLEYALSRP